MKLFKTRIFSIFGMALLATGFVACSSDNEGGSIINKEKSIKGMSLQIEDIDEFVEKHIHLALELGALLQESDILIDDNFEERLKNAETNEEVERLLTNYGFKEANSIIQIKEKMNINSKKLFIKNPFLYDLPFEEVKGLLSKKVNSDFELYIPNPEMEYPIEVKRTCEEQYKVDMYRCQRNHTVGLVASAVGGLATGGLATVGGYALSTIAYYFCQDDAIIDLNDCKKERDGKR